MPIVAVMRMKENLFHHRTCTQPLSTGMLPAALLAENIVQEDVKPPIFSDNDIEIIFRSVLVRDVVDRFERSRAYNTRRDRQGSAQIFVIKWHDYIWTM